MTPLPPVCQNVPRLYRHHVHMCFRFQKSALKIVSARPRGQSSPGVSLSSLPSTTATSSPSRPLPTSAIEVGQVARTLGRAPNSFQLGRSGHVGLVGEPDLTNLTKYPPPSRPNLICQTNPAHLGCVGKVWWP